jgi:hypothetical protein
LAESSPSESYPPICLSNYISGLAKNISNLIDEEKVKINPQLQFFDLICLSNVHVEGWADAISRTIDAIVSKCAKKQRGGLDEGGLVNVLHG